MDQSKDVELAITRALQTIDDELVQLSDDPQFHADIKLICADWQRLKDDNERLRNLVRVSTPV